MNIKQDKYLFNWINFYSKDSEEYEESDDDL